jgi:hypothetical protein
VGGKRLPQIQQRTGAKAINHPLQTEGEEDLPHRTRRVRRTLHRLGAEEEEAEEAEVTEEVEEDMAAQTLVLDLRGHRDRVVPLDRPEIQDHQGHLEVMEVRP